MNEAITPGNGITDEEIVAQLQNDLAATRQKLEDSRMAQKMAEERAAVSDKNAEVLAGQVAKLTQQRTDDHKAFQEAARNYKRKRVLSLKLPAFLLALFAMFAIGVMVAMDHALIVPALGEVVTVAAIVGATFCCGLIYERVRK